MSDNTEKIHKLVSGNKSFAAALQRELGDELIPTKSGKKGLIPALAKTDPGREQLLNHPNKRIRQLMQARTAIKSWPLHQRRIERMERIAKAADGKLPVPLGYCKSHTGRWAGIGGINLQNLPAHGDALITGIRNLIEAPLGHVLFIIDFAQIEARVLDWLADQVDMLQAFAAGEPIYCDFASRLVGHRVRKPRKTDNEIVSKWHGNYRGLGKVAILGAGYGMGANRCMKYAKDTYGLDVDYPMAEKIIKLYRTTHREVVHLWYKVERAFRLATMHSPQVYELEHGLKFFREDNATVIQLPSSRKLYYTGAKVRGTVRYPELEMPDPGKPGNTIHLWGGLLVENIVQAVSRDILAETVLKVEELGVRVPLIVHDDLSVVIPETEIDVYQPQIETIARTSPIWAEGLPVEIEGKVSREYIKL